MHASYFSHVPSAMVVVLIIGFEKPRYVIFESVGHGILGVRIREEFGQIVGNEFFMIQVSADSE